MTEIDVFYDGSLRTTCVHLQSGEKIHTDAPKDNMGKGEFFSPTDLVGAALGSCILTLMGIMANKLKVDLSGLRLKVTKQMALAPSRKIGKLTCHIYCPTRFDPQITARLEEAGRGCPVHHSLHPDIAQEIIFHWGEK